MFKTRLLSGILLVAIALLTICSGSYVLFFTLLGVSLIGMQELYKAMGSIRKKSISWRLQDLWEQLSIMQRCFLTLKDTP